jgi:hypothetical protein
MESISDPPLILHCHVPKTAGTTLSDRFRRSFGIHHLHHTHSGPNYILTRDALERLLEINPCLRSISSHHLQSFPTSVGGRSTFLITFLRKPEDHFVSLMRHCRRDFSAVPLQLRRECPNGVAQLPLRELCRRFLDTLGPGADYSPQGGFFYGRCPGRAKTDSSDSNPIKFDHYEVARSILSEFHFVGIVEEMKKSLQVLEDRLVQHGLNARLIHWGRKNAAPDRSSPAWLTMDDEVGRRVLQTGESDRRLHEHFRQALLESHRELPDRRWLGFHVAAVRAVGGFRDSGPAGLGESLLQSAHFYLKRHWPQDIPSNRPDPERSTELLEERALKAFGR